MPKAIVSNGSLSDYTTPIEYRLGLLRMILIAYCTGLIDHRPLTRLQLPFNMTNVYAQEKTIETAKKAICRTGYPLHIVYRTPK